MQWQTGKIAGENIYQEYQRKYGADSDYQEAQKIMYSHPDIQSGLATALHWMKLEPGARLLDIGVNNGHELTFLRSHYGDEIFRTFDISGFDLAEDALVQGSKEFADYERVRFIKGDIREFEGQDVLTQERVALGGKSYDGVFAFTSLQSTSLVRNFRIFMRKLNKILKDESQLFVVIPNCHVGADKKVVPGLYDAQKETVNYEAAEAFCAKLVFALHGYGFDFQKTGTHYIFLHFKRSEKKERIKEGGVFFALVEFVTELRT